MKNSISKDNTDYASCFSKLGLLISEIKKLNHRSKKKAEYLNYILTKIWLKDRIKTRMLAGSQSIQMIEEYKAREELILSVKDLLNDKIEQLMNQKIKI